MNTPAIAVDLPVLSAPGWLLVLLPVAAVALAIAWRTHRPAVAWPALAEARSAGARRFDRNRAAAWLLRSAALAALACVLAEPVGVHQAPPEPGYGLDLVLVVDASGSMRASDTRIEGQPRSRLELARQVVSHFAESRAAEGDRVALVAFGDSAFTPCPLSSDGRLLAAALGRVEAGVAGESTALGDALALAVKRAVANDAGKSSGAPVAGRVVVLLTDGRDNAGSISLEIATELARGEGVRVHTVGIGATGIEAPRVGPAADRNQLDLDRHDVDTAALEQVAALTGGRFFAARRSEQLTAVYRDIDALERVPRRMPPRVRRSDRPEPFLALAGACLLAEIALVRVLRRPIP
jgi:Ca-activated chloride channel family protein